MALASVLAILYPSSTVTSSTVEVSVVVAKRRSDQFGLTSCST
jgi:hypothetical protein